VEKRRKVGLLADGLKQLGAGVVGDVAGNGEGTVGARAFGVHTTLRNVFAVEVGELLDQVEIVEQQRAARAGGTGILVIGYRCAAGGGEIWLMGSSSVSLELPANRLGEVLTSCDTQIH
jgi:hypothetical protein